MFMIEGEYYKMYQHKYRIGTKSDLPFLKEMLYEAILWNQPENRPSLEEIFSHPDLNKILNDWGNREGDLSIIALDVDDQPVGAVWYRFFTLKDHSFGFVDEDIPELGIAIRKEFRGKGIGTFLMKKIIHYAKDSDIKGISLSVTPENYALRLYQKLGFHKVCDTGDAWTMLIDLD